MGTKTKTPLIQSNSISYSLKITHSFTHSISHSLKITLLCACAAGELQKKVRFVQILQHLILLSVSNSQSRLNILGNDSVLNGSTLFLFIATIFLFKKRRQSGKLRSMEIILFSTTKCFKAFSA